MRKILLSILITFLIYSCSNEDKKKTPNQSELDLFKSENLNNDKRKQNITLPPLGSYIFDANLNDFDYFGEFLDYEGILDFYLIQNYSFLVRGKFANKVVLYYKNGVLVRTQIIFESDILDELIRDFAKGKGAIKKGKSVFLIKEKGKILKYSRYAEFVLNEYLLQEGT